MSADEEKSRRISRRDALLIFIAVMLLFIASTFLSYTAIETVKLTLNHGQELTLKEWVWGSIISLALLFGFVWWLKVPLKAVNSITTP